MILSSRCLPASSSVGLRLSYKTPQRAKKFWRPLFLFHLRRITPPECRRRDRWPRRVPMRHRRPSKGPGGGQKHTPPPVGVKKIHNTPRGGPPPPPGAGGGGPPGVPLPPRVSPAGVLAGGFGVPTTPPLPPGGPLNWRGVCNIPPPRPLGNQILPEYALTWSPRRRGQSEP